MSSLVGLPDLHPTPDLSAPKVSHFCWLLTLYSLWEDLSQEEKRKIVESITERIIVGESEVTIHLAYLPSASEVMAEGQRNFMDSWPPPT